MTTSWISEPNKHIEQYLDYYCGDQKQSGYAVLINGDWGSGKTWFIKKYIDKIKANDPSKKVAYISLNGISKTSEIDDEIFKCIHPVLASKEAKLVGKIVKGAVKATLRIDVNGDGKQDTTLGLSMPNINVPDYLKINDKFLLVFDDLERCEIKIEETLGYINYFVEQEGIKTIIVSNEKELGGGGGDNIKYKRKREKLIDASFKYIEDSHVAVEVILKEIQDNYLRLEVIPLKNFISEIFDQVGSKNLRAFKQTIYAFERFYQKSYFEFKGTFDKELFKKILKSFIILSLENKKGAFCGGILSFPKTDNSDKTSDERARGKIGDAFRGISGEGASEFLDKYGFTLRGFILSIKNWEDILNNNILDESLITKELYDVYFILKDDPPVWRKLLDFWDLSDSEFFELIDDAKEIILSEKSEDIGEIQHIVSMLIYFRKNLLIKDELNVLIAKALENIQKILPVKDGVNELDYDEMEYAHSIGFYSNNDNDFKIFLDKIKENYKKSYRDSLNEKAVQLFNLMEVDSTLFSRRITVTNGDESFYMNVPVLKYINVKDFSDKLCSLKRRDLFSVLSALEKRYSTSYGRVEIYLEEKDWLDSVIKNINDKISQDTPLLTNFKIREKILPSLQKAKQCFDDISSS